MILKRFLSFALVLTVVAAVCSFGCGRSKTVGKQATGFLDSEGAVVDIEGWAWDPDQPDTPIRIEVYENDTLLSSVLAEEPREDLVKIGKGNGKHGFEIPFPAQLRDGKAHLIRVRIAEVNIELQNSPQSLTWRQPPAAKPPATKPSATGEPKPAKSGKTGDSGGA